jgi:hypothetical protein
MSYAWCVKTKHPRKSTKGVADHTMRKEWADIQQTPTCCRSTITPCAALWVLYTAHTGLLKKGWTKSCKRLPASSDYSMILYDAFTAAVLMMSTAPCFVFNTASGMCAWCSMNQHPGITFLPLASCLSGDEWCSRALHCENCIIDHECHSSDLIY